MTCRLCDETDHTTQDHLEELDYEVDDRPDGVFYGRDEISDADPGL